MVGDLPLMIRPAVLAEAPAIAAMHLQAWRESYAGLVPAGLLAGIDAAEHLGNWQRRLSASGQLIFSAWLGSQVVGICHCGPPRNREIAAFSDGELLALYVSQSAQRQGVGRRLAARAAQHWQAQGGHALGLQVLQNNLGAREFYEALGAVYAHDGAHAWQGQELKVAYYVWRDLSLLMQNSAPT